LGGEASGYQRGAQTKRGEGEIAAGVGHRAFPCSCRCSGA